MPSLSLTLVLPVPIMVQSWAIRAITINELSAGRWQYEVAPGLTAGETIMQVSVSLRQPLF